MKNLEFLWLHTQQNSKMLKLLLKHVTPPVHTQPPLDMKSLERKLPEMSFKTIEDLVQFDCSLFLGSEDSEEIETALVGITKIKKTIQRTLALNFKQYIQTLFFGLTFSGRYSVSWHYRAFSRR